VKLLLKRVLAFVCVALVLFGIVYNVVALPFSSPTFDLIAWTCIGAAFCILIYIGRK